MAFRKIDEEGILPGPRAVFISGFSEESFPVLQEFLAAENIEDITLVACRENMLDQTIGQVLEQPSEEALIPADKLPPVMLWSGIAHKELDHIIRNFVKNGLPRPIFATTTPRNLDFTVKTLMRHLLEDQREIREAQKKRAEQMKAEKAES